VSAVQALELPTLGVRLSLREQVAQALRSALVSGGMRPGLTYSVPVLADRLGVSATPVREAMLDLVRDGMVEAVPNKGFRVLAVSDSELDDVTQLRLLLEVPTVGSLSGRVDAVQLAQLRALAEQIHASAEVRDLAGYVGTDHRFHLQLLGLAGNGRLVELVGRLRARSRLYGLDHLTAGGLATSCAEHTDLLDALGEGRPRHQVEEIMNRHIGHVRGIWAARADHEPTGEPAREPDGEPGREAAREPGPP